MNINLFPKKDCKASIWSGGLTYEYMIYPKTANYADRDFVFRISSATIEEVPSKFTKFKGFYRYLVMLDNSLHIEINKEKKIYEKYEIMEFNSDDEVTSYTKGIDFNWMVSEKIRHHKLKITNINQNYNAEIIVLFSLDTTTITVNEKQYDLEPYDLLVIENPEKENVMLHFSTECLTGILDF
ncbi:environmental stress-induced protein Ves [Flavobacterium sp. 90]|uniref:HutD family protein n=1 Tax=unclassified Flavobacterium TaxID=196869 RepID=UPI000EB19AC7|nr:MULTISPECIES: HutD family protein [unclassified Flavobacterium]RKR08290.1 environmental stress-induced protein Ves [Flavobacterium sp. 81]TCK57478.1 environmental stress-induced protein Ves [Flavobacterium sp. 90]